VVIYSCDLFRLSLYFQVNLIFILFHSFVVFIQFSFFSFIYLFLFFFSFFIHFFIVFFFFLTSFELHFQSIYANKEMPLIVLLRLLDLK